MTDAGTPSIAPPPCPSDEAHWSRPFAMRQLQMLGELAEIGLDVARAVERHASGRGDMHPCVSPDGEHSQAEQPPSQRPVFQGDPALAYSRVSRAVRLTLMLQAKLVEDLKAAETADAKAHAAAEAVAREAREDRDPVYQAKARAELIVGRVAAARHAGDKPTLDRLTREAAERLDDEDLYGDLLEHPLSEIVARLCKHLGLDPDWSELAEDLWAVREVESGHVGRPLQEWTLMRPPPHAGEVARRAGGGIPPPLLMEHTCAPATSPSSAPDG